VCTNCNHLLEENKRLLEHLREGTCDRCATWAEENQKLTEEVSGLMFTVRKLGGVAAGQASALRKANAEDPRSKDIEFVITRWKRLCGHPRAKCPVDGKAWKAVKRALGPWGFTLEEILEAVEGAALAPFDAGYGRRKVAGTPKERKDDLGYVLRDEENIRKFRDISRRGHKASYDQLNAARIALMKTEHLYLTLMIEACNRRDTMALQVARAWHYSVGDETSKRIEDANGRPRFEEAA